VLEGPQMIRATSNRHKPAMRQVAGNIGFVPMLAPAAACRRWFRYCA